MCLRPHWNEARPCLDFSMSQQERPRRDFFPSMWWQRYSLYGNGYHVTPRVFGSSLMYVGLLKPLRFIFSRSVTLKSQCRRQWAVSSSSPLCLHLWHWPIQERTHRPIFKTTNAKCIVSQLSPFLLTEKVKIQFALSCCYDTGPCMISSQLSKLYLNLACIFGNHKLIIRE